MLMIRLQRVGRRHDPSYRVVVTEKTAGPKSGKPVEVVGSYDARQEEGKTNPQLKEDRILHWISQGAQPSGTVHNLLIGAGIIKGDKINVLPKRKPVEETDQPAQAGEEKKEEAAPAEGGEEAPATETPAEGGDEKAAPAEEAPAEEAAAPAEETPAEEEPKTEEAPAEDKKEETEEKKEE